MKPHFPFCNMLVNVLATSSTKMSKCTPVPLSEAIKLHKIILDHFLFGNKT